MNIDVRQEREEDFETVFHLIKDAFKDAMYSDHQEHFFVSKLRTSDAFIPELSLVAEVDGKVVGHILLTKIKIKNASRTFNNSLALAPVSVLPEYQNNGIGTALIKAAHDKAQELGFAFVVVLGHAQYYPKFGYRPAREFGIRLPFDVPEENCFAIDLTNDLQEMNGVVEYSKEFYE